jgi:hypothetical protein
LTLNGQRVVSVNFSEYRDLRAEFRYLLREHVRTLRLERLKNSGGVGAIAACAVSVRVGRESPLAIGERHVNQLATMIPAAFPHATTAGVAVDGARIHGASLRSEPDTTEVRTTEVDKKALR